MDVKIDKVKNAPANCLLFSNLTGVYVLPGVKSLIEPLSAEQELEEHDYFKKSLLKTDLASIFQSIYKISDKLRQQKDIERDCEVICSELAINVQSHAKIQTNVNIFLKFLNQKVLTFNSRRKRVEELRELVKKENASLEAEKHQLADSWSVILPRIKRFADVTSSMAAGKAFVSKGGDLSSSDL
jgi:hypothetical protein